MKIQPIDLYLPEEVSRYETVKPVVKSRFKRLFDLPSFLKVSAVDKAAGVEEFEPSSICLDKMVQNFMEDSNDKQSVTIKSGYNQYRCFNGDGDDDSEDEQDFFNCFGNSNNNSSNDACEVLKALVVCASVSERNLLADTAKIMDKFKVSKDESGRNVIVESLIIRGYDASICKSRWEKSPTYPAGEYEYIAVAVEGERLIIDIDFRSEFEIARATKSYKSVLQILPQIFVGKAERLEKIIQVVCDAAKQSLKKKGLHFPPWRKADYVKAKWLAPNTQSSSIDSNNKPDKTKMKSDNKPVEGGKDGKVIVVVKEWEPPGVKVKGFFRVKVVTGLASVIEEEGRPNII